MFLNFSDQMETGKASCRKNFNFVMVLVVTNRGKVINRRVANPGEKGNARTRRHELEGIGFKSQCWL